MLALEGGCYCRAVTFTALSHTPYPYMRCYCSFCRTTSGSGGYGINIMAEAETLAVAGSEFLGRHHGMYHDERANAGVRCGRRTRAGRSGCIPTHRLYIHPCRRHRRPSTSCWISRRPGSRCRPGAVSVISDVTRMRASSSGIGATVCILNSHTQAGQMCPSSARVSISACLGIMRWCILSAATYVRDQLWDASW